MRCQVIIRYRRAGKDERKPVGLGDCCAGIDVVQQRDTV